MEILFVEADAGLETIDAWAEQAVCGCQEEQSSAGSWSSGCSEGVGAFEFPPESSGIEQGPWQWHELGGRVAS